MDADIGGSLYNTAITINFSFLKAAKIILYIFGIFLILFGLYNLSNPIPSIPYTIYAYEGVIYSILLFIFGIVCFYGAHRL